MYKQSGKLLDTSGKLGADAGGGGGGGGELSDVKWIFVLSASKLLYVGQKKKGRFQHSSFLAGGATLSAGRLVVEQGILKVRLHPPTSYYFLFFPFRGWNLCNLF